MAYTENKTPQNLTSIDQLELVDVFIVGDNSDIVEQAKKIPVSELVQFLTANLPSDAVISVNGETGEVIISASDLIDGATLPTATIADEDKILIQDADDASRLKTVLVSDLPGSNLPDSGSVDLRWIFVAGTTDSDPNSNSFKLNNTDPALVTEIYVSDVSYPNRNVSNIIGILKTGDAIYLQQSNDATVYINADITSDPIDNGTYWTIPVTVFDSDAAFVPSSFCNFLIYHTNSVTPPSGDISVDLINYKNGTGAEVDQGLVSSTATLDWENKSHVLDLDGDLTLLFSNAVDGREIRASLKYNSATVITWPSITWNDNATGAAPTTPSAAGQVLNAVFWQSDGTIYGSAAGNYPVY